MITGWLFFPGKGSRSRRWVFESYVGSVPSTQGRVTRDSSLYNRLFDLLGRSPGTPALRTGYHHPPKSVLRFLLINGNTDSKSAGMSRCFRSLITRRCLKTYAAGVAISGWIEIPVFRTRLEYASMPAHIDEPLVS